MQLLEARFHHGVMETLHPEPYGFPHLQIPHEGATSGGVVERGCQGNPHTLIMINLSILDSLHYLPSAGLLKSHPKLLRRSLRGKIREPSVVGRTCPIWRPLKNIA